MSYDIYLECESCGEEGFSRNMTSNVAPMWRLAGCQLHEFEGKKASELLPSVDAAIKAMTADPETYRSMNPSNGWGSYEGCLDFLREIRQACEDKPDLKVRIWR